MHIRVSGFRLVRFQEFRLARVHCTVKIVLLSSTNVVSGVYEGPKKCTASGVRAGQTAELKLTLFIEVGLLPPCKDQHQPHSKTEV